MCIRDRYIGEKGTPKRDAYEEELNSFLIGEAIKQARQSKNLTQGNQKTFLLQYVRQQGWPVTEIYADDGYTGTNFDRPAFQRLLEDIRKKRSDLVITKDYCAIIGLNQKDLENQGILA